jgi:hypothetical protein
MQTGSHRSLLPRPSERKPTLQRVQNPLRKRHFPTRLLRSDCPQGLTGRMAAWRLPAAGLRLRTSTMTRLPISKPTSFATAQPQGPAAAEARAAGRRSSGAGVNMSGRAPALQPSRPSPRDRVGDRSRPDGRGLPERLPAAAPFRFPPPAQCRSRLSAPPRQDPMRVTWKAAYVRESIGRRAPQGCVGAQGPPAS